MSEHTGEKAPERPRSAVIYDFTTKAAKPPYTLEPTESPSDIRGALSNLVRDMLSGDLVGFSFTAMYRNGRYRTGTAGELYRNPTFAIGTVVILLARLIVRVLKKHP